MDIINETMIKIGTAEAVLDMLAKSKPESVEDAVRFIQSFRDGMKDALESLLPGKLPRTECAYCKIEMRPGPEPTSHGCCPICKEIELAKIQRIPRGLDGIIDRGVMPQADDKMFEGD